MRLAAVRWLVVLLLAPLTTLSAFGGTLLLAHGHDEHGMHLHSMRVELVDGQHALDHAFHHGHEHPPADAPADNDASEPISAPEGIVVSLPDHGQLPTRTADLSKTLVQTATIAVTAWLLPPPPQIGCSAYARGGPSQDGPLDLRALSAGDRLVRTSRALLI